MGWSKSFSRAFYLWFIMTAAAAIGSLALDIKIALLVLVVLTVSSLPGAVVLAVIIRSVSTYFPSRTAMQASLLTFSFVVNGLLLFILWNFGGPGGYIPVLTFGGSILAVTVAGDKLDPDTAFSNSIHINQSSMEQQVHSGSPLENRSGLSTQNRLLLKGLIIGGLILLMLIPGALIQELVMEREQRQNEVVREVNSKWASSQTIAGPLLVVPYRESYIDENGKPKVRENEAFFLPENLKINGELTPIIRKRSLYKVPLYNSDVTLQGNFRPISIAEIGLQPEQMLWKKARIAVGLTDLRGMEEIVSLRWDSVSYPLKPSATPGIKSASLATQISLDPMVDHSFKVSLRLKGSTGYFLSPSAVATEAEFRSTWKDPAFDGDFIPTGVPEVTDQGFSARWKILGQNANLPPSWTGGKFSIGEMKFGVNLLEPTNSYAKTMRSAKYAILFIGLTFGLFFLIEATQKKAVHPLQYLLIGLALTIFYTLLLSFSEFLGFDFAYLIAAVATILLITLYVRSIFVRWKIAGLLALVLTMLYSFIYVLIQEQDKALLLGSVGLFVILALVMFYSRRINWYDEPKPVTA